MLRDRTGQLDSADVIACPVPNPTGIAQHERHVGKAERGVAWPAFDEVSDEFRGDSNESLASNTTRESQPARDLASYPRVMGIHSPTLSSHTHRPITI